MKAAAMMLVLVLVLPSLALAREWDTTNTLLEIGYQAAAAVDWSQTHQSQHQYKTESFSHSNPDGSATWGYRRTGYEETNLILGGHPSSSKINAYFAITGVAHAAISYGLTKLPTPDWVPVTWDRLWQGVTIGIEAGQVIKNYSIGVHTEF